MTCCIRAAFGDECERARGGVASFHRESWMLWSALMVHAWVWTVATVCAIRTNWLTLPYPIDWFSEFLNHSRVHSGC